VNNFYEKIICNPENISGQGKAATVLVDMLWHPASAGGWTGGAGLNRWSGFSAGRKKRLKPLFCRRVSVTGLKPGANQKGRRQP
jgi:hypothetical protein